MTDHPTMECRCGEISLHYIGTVSMKGSPDLLEYRCDKCGFYQTFSINSTAIPVHLRNQAE